MGFGISQIVRRQQGQMENSMENEMEAVLVRGCVDMFLRKLLELKWFGGGLNCKGYLPQTTVKPESRLSVGQPLLLKTCKPQTRS